MYLRFTFLLVVIALGTSCSKEDVFQNDALIDLPMYENAKAFETELLLAVNDYRQSIGKSKLKLNKVAYEYANQHSDYMISIDTINHDNFSYRSSKIKDLTPAKHVSENVARNFKSANGVILGWINSPSHKKTLEGNYTHTGISIKIDMEDKFYFTQIFFR